MNQALIICGSTRGRLGITYVASKLAKHLFKKQKVNAQIILLSELYYSPCNGCNKLNNDCNIKHSPCEKQDDIIIVMQKMIESDIIIYATPVYAFGVAHLMQIFLERIGVGYLRFNRPLINKIGGIIIVGRRYNLGSVHDQLINNMLLNRMIICGAGFPVLINNTNHKTKTISSNEELVALESMIYRICNVASAINFSKLNNSIPNERKLIYEKNNC